MSAIRVCPHGCASSASCPICAPIEDRPVGLYQFAPAAGEYALRSMSAAEQLEWGMRYIRERYGEAPVTVGSLDEWHRLFGWPERPRRLPWWARAVAWVIAAYYAVRR